MRADTFRADEIGGRRMAQIDAGRVVAAPSLRALRRYRDETDGEYLARITDSALKAGAFVGLEGDPAAAERALVQSISGEPEWISVAFPCAKAPHRYITELPMRADHVLGGRREIDHDDLVGALGVLLPMIASVAAAAAAARFD